MVHNFIETKYFEINERFPQLKDGILTKLYGNIKPPKLAELFELVHCEVNSLIKLLNSRLPTTNNTSYYWADSSRDLIFVIDLINELVENLKKTEFEFQIDGYYSEVFRKCLLFLNISRGSQIPGNMDKVTLYYTRPIFIQEDTIKINSINNDLYSRLITIGRGSYGIVYKFKDEFYDTWFALKRASKDLSAKDLERFKNEYKFLSESNSPYIIKVYRYRDEKNEYIMELMDCSLDEYYKSKNNGIPFAERKSIGYQVIKAIKYINSKNLFHRDICPKNILIKQYDYVTIAKVSDFGLIKISESTLTSDKSDVKGSYNDPELSSVGFHNYSLPHEIYALTKTLRFVLTGRTNIDKPLAKNFQNFSEKGMCVDCTKRYKSIEEVEKAFRGLQ